MTQADYLEVLRSGESMKFDTIIALVDDDYAFTQAAFTNGDLRNQAGEGSGSAKVFCFAAIHQLTPLETLHCFGEHYLAVLNDADGDSHPNIRNFMVYGWAGLKFDSPVLIRK